LEYRGGSSRVVGRIRRALVYVPAEGSVEALAWVKRALDGSELIPENQAVPPAVLSLISERERNVRTYLQSSNVWESVTPIVLPGRDDRKQKKTERLIRKAIMQAGFSEMLATHAEIDWRSTSFWPGGEHANRYFLPDHLRNFPRCHCQIRWKDAQGNDLKIAGPIAIGGGKYAGLGLFASPSV
jgi:CRISPR-associated protein Csb2